MEETHQDEADEMNLKVDFIIRIKYQLLISWFLKRNVGLSLDHADEER